MLPTDHHLDDELDFDGSLTRVHSAGEEHVNDGDASGRLELSRWDRVEADGTVVLGTPWLEVTGPGDLPGFTAPAAQQFAKLVTEAATAMAA